MATFETFAAEVGIRLYSYEHDAHIAAVIAAYKLMANDRVGRGVRYGRPMRLELHVADTASLNGFAASMDDADVIAINRGTFPILLSLARALVSQGVLFPEIMTEGADTPPAFLHAPPAVLASGEYTRNVPPLPDPLRENIAQEIYRLALLFIFEHEFSHIFNGHTDYIGKQNGLSLLTELEASGVPSVRGLERETLEWDADASAVQSALEYALRPTVSQVEGRAVWSNIGVDSVLGSPSAAAKALAVALFTCFALFASQDASDPLSPAPRSHPHPLFRVNSSAGLISHIIRFRTGGTLDDQRSAVRTALEESFNSWEQVFSQAGGIRFHFKAEPEFVNAQAERLEAWEKCWTGLHDHLDGMKRGGRLAPKEPTKHPAFPDHSEIG